MADQTQHNALKYLMTYLGITLVLVGATAVKGDNLPLFFLGLVLLAFQVFDFKAVAPVKLIMAELMLAITLGVAAVTQLVLAKNFNAPQAFLVVLLIGVVLIIVDAIRKFGEAG